MTKSRKAAAALAVAALTITATGLLAESGEGPRRPVVRSSSLVDRAAPGQRTTDDVLAIWSSRSAANETDYLSRTHLGDALLRKARETGQLDLYGEAESVFSEALSINGRYPPALLGMGAARAARHDFAGQRELARQVLATNAGSLPAIAALGDASYELGDYDAAARAYAQLAAVEQSPPVLARLARLAAIDGRGDEAVRQARRALTQARELDLGPPALAEYHFQLAHHRYTAGDVAGAATALEAALRLVPAHLGSLELLAQVRAAQGRITDAVRLYEQLIERGPAADLHGSLAALYAELGDATAADLQIAKGLEVGYDAIGRYPAERRHLAAFFARHDPADALQLAEEDLRTRGDVYAHDVHAWALFRNGRHADAVDAARHAMARGTRDARLWFHAGMAEAAVGNRVAAKELLSGALEINPRFDVADAPLAARTLASLG